MSKPRKAWCPVCRVVEMVDGRWRCVWCLTLTLKRRGTPRESRAIWPSLLHEAHEAHAAGASVRDAAMLIQDRAGYANTRLLAERLPCWWAGIGLPCRSLSDAQRLRSVRGRLALKRPDITLEVAQRAVDKHGTRHAAAAALGCSRKTLRRRLDAELREAGL